jgi:DNA adenine methylase
MNEKILVEKNLAKPFLKWAGGKSQLLSEFPKYFPKELITGKIQNYYEPFLGSGAVFFFVAQKFSIKKAILSDINEELILTFNVVKQNVRKLVEELEKLKAEYLNLSEKERENYFYDLRLEFNQSKSQVDFKNYSSNWIKRASQIIFLNKTCFNGLFRLNKNGEFNVPFGKYKNPQIYDEENLLKASELLKIADIHQTDFEEIKKYASENFFIYFDPPYRPISKTSSFTSYSKFSFNETDQLRLAKLFSELGVNENKLMLSNSDPKNENPNDDFFEKHYQKFNINRVKALRVINSKAEKRGAINELIITNY